ncbi:MAG: hypothetical protein LBP33_13590 [Candidatus Adiutrix sp.]|jgi:hypothetical protein|nr:hypothetical protein [Candidatus Adiutrix sp.]
MTHSVILSDFQIELDYEEMRDKLRVRPGSRAEPELRAVFEKTSRLARPRAALKVVRPATGRPGQVRLDEVGFESELLAEKLAGLDKAFVYVANAGVDLAAWVGALGGLEQYLADQLSNYFVRRAVDRLEAYIMAQYGLRQVSAMKPGSLPRHWPLSQQGPLFQLMGDLPEKIGVRLLPSFLMAPGKCVSGVYFESGVKFHSCQLCPNPGCPARRSPFQAAADAASPQ